jgi:hypothetical protein
VDAVLFTLAGMAGASLLEKNEKNLNRVDFVTNMTLND